MNSDDDVSQKTTSTYGMTDGNDYDVDGEVGVPRGEVAERLALAARLRADGSGSVSIDDAIWRKQHRRAHLDGFGRRGVEDYAAVAEWTPSREQPDHRGVVVVRV